MVIVKLLEYCVARLETRNRNCTRLNLKSESFCRSDHQNLVCGRARRARPRNLSPRPWIIGHRSRFEVQPTVCWQVKPQKHITLHLTACCWNRAFSRLRKSSATGTVIRKLAQCACSFECRIARSHTPAASSRRFILATPLRYEPDGAISLGQLRSVCETTEQTLFGPTIYPTTLFRTDVACNEDWRP